MASWITFDGHQYGCPTALSLDHIAVIYFERNPEEEPAPQPALQPSHEHAQVRFASSAKTDTDDGETWFRVTDPEAVQSLRDYVNANRRQGFPRL